MTSKDLDNALDDFNIFQAIPYFAEVIPLLLVWIKLNLIESGSLVKLFPIRILRIGIYFRITRLFIALVQDIILITKKQHPNKLKKILT